MRQTTIYLLATIVILTGCSAKNGPPSGTLANKDVFLLTTTSFQDSGLADALAERFSEQTGYNLKIIAVGTGAALKQGSQGEGDVLITHAAELEKKWMAAGYGTSRRLVMYNHFIIAGPRTDPAGIKGKSPIEAFRRIAESGSPFVSRGDNSGTHVREKSLWAKAEIDPAGQPWYIESGQGMGLTLQIASEQQRHTLSDRGTFLAQRKTLDLDILLENGGMLLNLYHVMSVNQQKFPRINAQGGKAFAEFLLSEPTQEFIGDFGRTRFGSPLFTPAAGNDEVDIDQ